MYAQSLQWTYIASLHGNYDLIRRINRDRGSFLDSLIFVQTFRQRTKVLSGVPHLWLGLGPSMCRSHQRTLLLLSTPVVRRSPGFQRPTGYRISVFLRADAANTVVLCDTLRYWVVLCDIAVGLKRSTVSATEWKWKWKWKWNGPIPNNPWNEWQSCSC